MKIRHFWITGALIAALAAWAVAQAPMQNIMNAFDAGAAGAYRLGANAGISSPSSTVVSVDTSIVGNAAGSLRALAIATTAASATGWQINTFITGLALGPSAPIGWGAANQTTGVDTGIERISAGVVGLNNGTTNTGGGLQIPTQKSTTGQRFACFTTTGLIVSSATACVGT
jgi:hypothetical protein